MTRGHRFSLLVALFVFTCLVAACGGGGGSTAPSTSVNGVASKGPIKNGLVSVYAVNADGSRGRLLGTDRTSTTDGSYQVQNLGYDGSIIIVVTEGKYLDEATGVELDNPGLKAALPNATGAVSVAVTPLTDVAFKQMSSAVGGFTAANITNSNAVVSTAFGVDIIGTLPADATSATSVAGSSQSAIEYGVALAAVSQMIKNGDAADVMEAIEKIKDDLSGSTPQLTTTGAAFAQAISDLTSGTTPVLAPTISTSTISVDDSIQFFTTNTVNPPSNATGVAQAKGLISDLRNTVLAVVNYRTGEVTAALQTPFDAAVNEIETVVQPELTPAVERLGWAGSSLAGIPVLEAGTTYTFTDSVRFPGETLTITTAATGYTATATIASASATLMSGSITVSDLTMPTSGSMNITTLRTLSGNATATLSYTGTVSGQIFSAMTFTGNITTPVATFDFADSSKGHRLSAEFALIPGTVDSMMLTKAYFKGVAATSTVRITGSIDVPSLVFNQTMSVDASIPSAGTVSGKIEALSNGSATLTLNGTLTGAFTNAATYNANIPGSATNFPVWNGTFDGSIVSTGGLNISVLLKASMTQFDIINFEAKYTRVLPDSSTIFLSSTGTANLQTGITTATMSNQNSMQVAITFNENLGTDSRFSGTIKTAGGETVANFSSVSSVPRVTYDDGFFETLM